MLLSEEPGVWSLESLTLVLSLEPGKCVFDALEKLENCFQLNLSDVMICGLLEMTVNVMQFENIRWL